MKAAFELSALHTQGEANGETLRQTADGRCEPGTLIGTHFPRCHHRHHKACVIVQTDKRGFEESEKLSAQSVLLKALVLFSQPRATLSSRALNSLTLKALWNLLPYRSMTKAHSLFISNLVSGTGYGIWNMGRNEKMYANKEQRRRVIPEKTGTSLWCGKQLGRTLNKQETRWVLSRKRSLSVYV